MTTDPAHPIQDAALDQLFRAARTHNGWLPGQVTDEQIHALYDLLKMGPTSANCSPARFVFVRSEKAKEKLRPSLSSGNMEKTMKAPVTVIVAYDQTFYEKLPALFPHADARSWFTSSPELAEETAFRNGTLQGAYLILAARATGLDAGPMSGFNRKLVDEAFFGGTTWRSNFLVNIGRGDDTKLFQRLPRMSFEEACTIA